MVDENGKTVFTRVSKRAFDKEKERRGIERVGANYIDRKGRYLYSKYVV